MTLISDACWVCPGCGQAWIPLEDDYCAECLRGEGEPEEGRRFFYGFFVGVILGGALWIAGGLVIVAGRAVLKAIGII